MPFAQRVTEAVAQPNNSVIHPGRLHPDAIASIWPPAALHDVLEILGWGWLWSKRSPHKTDDATAHARGGGQLHPAVTIIENTRDGVAPNFQEDGFLKPDQVHLIASGSFRGSVWSHRAQRREYGALTNGAPGREAPESLEIGRWQSGT